MFSTVIIAFPRNNRISCCERAFGRDELHVLHHQVFWTPDRKEGWRVQPGRRGKVLYLRGRTTTSVNLAMVLDKAMQLTSQVLWKTRGHITYSVDSAEQNTSRWQERCAGAKNRMCNIFVVPKQLISYSRSSFETHSHRKISSRF